MCSNSSRRPSRRRRRGRRERGTRSGRVALTGCPRRCPKPPGSPVMSGLRRRRQRAVSGDKGRSQHAVSLAEPADTLVHSELARHRQDLSPVFEDCDPAADQPAAGRGQRVRRAAHLRRGVMAMVPEGLVLLTSVALRSGSSGWVRSTCSCRSSSPSKDWRADILCLDKTGTLTEGSIVVQSVETIGQAEGVPNALGAIASADPSPNATAPRPARCVRRSTGLAGHGNDPVLVGTQVGAVAFTEQGSWFLGAPDVLLPIAVRPPPRRHGQGAGAGRGASQGRPAWCSSHSRLPLQRRQPTCGPHTASARPPRRQDSLRRH